MTLFQRRTPASSSAGPQDHRSLAQAELWKHEIGQLHAVQEYDDDTWRQAVAKIRSLSEPAKYSILAGQIIRIESTLPAEKKMPQVYALVGDLMYACISTQLGDQSGGLG